jgi:hypothetical protein
MDIRKKGRSISTIGQGFAHEYYLLRNYSVMPNDSITDEITGKFQKLLKQLRMAARKYLYAYFELSAVGHFPSPRDWREVSGFQVSEDLLREVN